MRILHVITTLDVGGAEMHLLSQVRGQARRGHGVRVAWLKGEGRLTDDFREAGAEWGGAAGRGPGTPLRLWPHLRWAEIVHSHLLKADVATAILATLAGRRRRLLSGKHNDEQILRRPLVSWLHGLIGRLPVRTIVLSDHVGRFVAEHGRVPLSRQVRIYYGIDPAPFEEAAGMGERERAEARREHGFADGEVVFICVAGVAPPKAPEGLVGLGAPGEVGTGASRASRPRRPTRSCWRPSRGPWSGPGRAGRRGCSWWGTTPSGTGGSGPRPARGGWAWGIGWSSPASGATCPASWPSRTSS